MDDIWYIWTGVKDKCLRPPPEPDATQHTRYSQCPNNPTLAECVCWVHVSSQWYGYPAEQTRDIHPMLGSQQTQDVEPMLV